MPLFQKRLLSIAEQVALIALGGVITSVFVWFGHAYVIGVLFEGQSFTEAFVSPDTTMAWSRLVAIVSVLLGTLMVQVVYAGRAQMRLALELERDRTRQMYDNSPDAVLCLDTDGTVRYTNARAQEMAGLSADAMVGRRCFEVAFGAAAPCEDCELALAAAGETHQHTLCAVVAGGDARWLSCLRYPVLDSDGGVDSIVEVIRDVTDLRTAEEALDSYKEELEARIQRRTQDLADANTLLETEISEHIATSLALRDSEERYRSLIDNSPDMIVVSDGEQVTFVNPAGARLLGIEDQDTAIGRLVTDVFESCSPDVSAEALTEALSSGVFSRPFACRVRHHDGEAVDVEVTGMPLEFGGEHAVQFVARDISERVTAEETIRRMAYYDPLTGLPNRALFGDRLLVATQQAKRDGYPLAIAFLDLDDFKAVNDSLGHLVGDDLLRAVANRLREQLREGDTIARLSGDEFTIIGRLRDTGDADAFAQRLLSALEETFTIDDRELAVTASIGIALYPDHALEGGDLLRHADAAMYSAKESGRNIYRLYSPSMGLEVRVRLDLEHRLRTALADQEFRLRYQPQVDARTGSIVGVEALLRWEHPDHGELTPAAFMEVAEQSWIMGRLGKWVLWEACSQAKAWLDDGLDFGRLAVNLSAREFRQNDVVASVAQVLRDTGLPAERLELEITETTALDSIESVLEKLNALRALGVRIAIDDFGTGYSSLSYITRFPIHTLKIAQSFMCDVHMHDQSAGIAGMMIDLCQLLELDIVAEGVECHDQLDFLSQRGCHVIQGYLFSKPVWPDEVATLIAAGGIAVPSVSSDQPLDPLLPVN
jgi:diguanylate cyclase (GGDEF)-like protein/PAS domain S-box-containing protein